MRPDYLLMQAGQTVLVRVKAVIPGGMSVKEGTVIADFWAPGRDPQHDPADRDRPDHSLPCTYSAAERGWTALADTTGWTPGQWVLRGRVAAATPLGNAKGWDWSTLVLDP